jgi:hypothetical protein
MNNALLIGTLIGENNTILDKWPASALTPCFVISRRDAPARETSICAYADALEMDRRPLVVVVRSSDAKTYCELRDAYMAATGRRGWLTLELPPTLSGEQLASEFGDAPLFQTLKKIEWRHDINRDLNAGFARLVVQMFAVAHGIDWIHFLDDNINVNCIQRRVCGDVTSCAPVSLTEAFGMLERCLLEPTDEQNAAANLAGLTLCASPRDKIVVVGCQRNLLHLHMAQQPFTSTRPYSFSLINIALAKKHKLWYRPCPVAEDVQFVDDARRKGLAVIKMQALAHTKNFRNNLNAHVERVSDIDDDNDDSHASDMQTDNAAAAAETFVVNAQKAHEDRYWAANKSDALFVIESDSAAGAALIAHFLLARAVAVCGPHAQLRVRSSAPEFEQAIANVGMRCNAVGAEWIVERREH